MVRRAPWLVCLAVPCWTASPRLALAADLRSAGAIVASTIDDRGRVSPPRRGGLARAEGAPRRQPRQEGRDFANASARANGYSALELLTSGFTSEEVEGLGFTAGEIQGAMPEVASLLVRGEAEAKCPPPRASPGCVSDGGDCKFVWIRERRWCVFCTQEGTPITEDIVGSMQPKAQWCKEAGDDDAVEEGDISQKVEPQGRQLGDCHERNDDEAANVPCHPTCRHACNRCAHVNQAGGDQCMFGWCPENLLPEERRHSYCWYRLGGDLADGEVPKYVMNYTSCQKCAHEQFPLVKINHRFYVNLLSKDNNWSWSGDLYVQFRKLLIVGVPQVGDKTITVDLTDYTYSSNNGLASPGDKQDQMHDIGWGITRDCRNYKESTFKIDLTGTPFGLKAKNMAMEAKGMGPHGNVDCLSEQACEGHCGGRCGWCGICDPFDDECLKAVTLDIIDPSMYNNLVEMGISLPANHHPRSNDVPEPRDDTVQRTRHFGGPVYFR